MITNAQKIGQTRLCGAQNCGDDAEPHWTLCARHDRMLRRGVIVTLHEPPEFMPETLRCSACGEHKPDNAFARARDNPHRRNRHQECRECSAKRRAKRVRTPEQVARQTHLARTRRARKARAQRAEINAELAAIRLTFRASQAGLETEWT